MPAGVMRARQRLSPRGVSGVERVRELAAAARRDDEIEHVAARDAHLDLDRLAGGARGRRGVLEVGAGVRIEAGDQLLLQLVEERAELRRAARVAQLVAGIDVEDALERRARRALVVADELRERDQLERAQALRAGGAGVARDRRERLDRACVLLFVEQLLAALEVRLDRLRARRRRRARRATAASSASRR